MKRYYPPEVWKFSPCALFSNPFSMSDCAHEELRDESQIIWYYDADDDDPMPPAAPPASSSIASSRAHRAKFPAAKLMVESGNTAKPALKSHQAAIKANLSCPR
jgi:hypothetical protein